jgi:hypothetical protein
MSLATNLLRIALLADSASALLPRLTAVRAAYSDSEWQQLEEAHPEIADLVAACCDIEAAVEALE